MSDRFPIRNDLKQGDAITLMHFNFALEYTIGKFQVNQDGFKLNGTHQFWLTPLMLINRDEADVI